MSADEHQTDEERRVALRHEVMAQIQRGDTFTLEEIALADGLDIRVPAYLRPGADDGPDAVPDHADPYDPRTATGQAWVEEFYTALAELWAAAGWMPFAFGQIGALLGRGERNGISEDDQQALTAMLDQVSGDVADLAEATKRVLVVAQHDLTNARNNANDQRAAATG